MEKIEGVVTSIINQSEDNLFVIGVLKASDEEIKFLGNLPDIKINQRISLEGERVIHKKYGEQFSAVSYEEILPSTREGIVAYLGSKLIKGIGRKTAQRIVDKFGEGTYEILDNDIDRLLEIPTIGEVKLKDIKESYNKHRGLKNLIGFLTPMGITPKQCQKIYAKYKEDSIKAIKENPYRLSNEIKNFGFERSDKIAEKIGIEKDSPFRIESAFMYILRRASGAGHTMMLRDTLIEEAGKLLNLEDNSLNLVLNDILLKGQNLKKETFDENEYIFHKQFWNYERYIADKIYTMATSPKEALKIDMESFLDGYEEKHSISLHELQREAIASIIEEKVLIITGGPGTGKTTIIKGILEVLKRCGKKVALAAPTGRASKRMKEATGYEASTIHRLLEITVSDDDNFDDESGEVLNFDAVIVDEASMVDVILMKNLMSSLKETTRLIFVGDVDQLPSVGPGRVLSDLIECAAIKVIKLERIYRQGKESLITSAAHDINGGIFPREYNKGDGDFFLLNATESTGRELLKDLIGKRLPETYGFDMLKDIQVLCPMKKRALGVEEVNEVLREVLNPSKDTMEGFTDFRLGDKVMQIKNNYNLKGRRNLIRTPREKEDESGVFNGDIGYIAAIDDEQEILTVLFDDERYVDYESSDLDDLELAYGITIHKSQGSEFKCVLIPVISDGGPGLFSRNLIYTGVTRGKKIVIIIMIKSILTRMIKNTSGNRRYTSLKKFLRKIDEFNNHKEEEPDIADVMEINEEEDIFFEDMDFDEN